MANLSLEELKKLAQQKEIDTVLAVFPDYYGRLMGKRLTVEYFLEQEHFFCCDYLLTAGMEMEPRAGFSLASWEKGYGDFTFVPDFDTLRQIPWLEKTALVICDLMHEKGTEVAQAPRNILKKQCRKLAERGWQANMASELEFHLFKESFTTLQQNNYRDLTPSTPYRIDYHILGTTFDEGVIRAIRNGMAAADIPIECSKGECGAGQHEIGLYYADALEMADRHVIYKNGAKEIAAQHEVALSFMAKYKTTEAGSSCHIHSSIFDTKSKSNVFWDRKADQPSDNFRYFLGGLLQLTREFFLLLAPTVNSYKRYCAASFAPTRIVWSYDNRTAGYRIVSRGPSYRIENRMPGADTNAYLAFAATVAAGLYGIENKIACPKEFTGDAYTTAGLPVVPATLTEAADLLDKSSIARSCFGDAVVDHYVQCAQAELNSYNQSVTDWELRRYFERI